MTGLCVERERSEGAAMLGRADLPGVGVYIEEAQDQAQDVPKLVIVIADPSATMAEIIDALQRFGTADAISLAASLDPELCARL
jgi:hypothetical protein